MLSFIQMVARVVLTIFPATILRKKVRAYVYLNLAPLVDTFVSQMIKGFLQHLPPEQHPTLAPIHNHLSSKMPRINRQITSLLLVPVFLVGVVLLASLERTPLTGRWRTILLSPEEEEKVASDLIGDGWYNSIATILTNNHPAGIPRSLTLVTQLLILISHICCRVVPLNDWRTQWVLDTMRRLG